MVRRAYDEAQREGRDVDSERLKSRAEAIARGCAPSSSVSSARVGQLPALALLYVEARRHRSADAAIRRYLNSRRVGAGGKAETLLRGIGSALYSYSLHAAADPPRAAHAETWMKSLEALGPAFARQQLDGHARLARHYLSAGDGAGALRHQGEVSRLASGLEPGERQGALSDFFLGLLTLADLQCNRYGTARSLALLKGISPELVRLAGIGRTLDAARARYELGGRPVPELKPRYVLNDAGGAAGASARGRVTVLVFAAHWCGPCRAIYPRASEVYRRFHGEGVRVLLVTRLYGYFGERSGLKPEEELSALRDYYVGEVGLPFPVLVEESRPRAGVGGESEGADGAAAGREGSLFGSLPLILLVDRGGTTRAVLVGSFFDQGERLRTKVEELLKEPD